MVYGAHSYGTKICWYFLKLVMFVLASFIFSAIFWATQKWLDKKPKKRKKK